METVYHEVAATRPTPVFARLSQRLDELVQNLADVRSMTGETVRSFIGAVPAPAGPDKKMPEPSNFAECLDFNIQRCYQITNDIREEIMRLRNQMQ